MVARPQARGGSRRGHRCLHSVDTIREFERGKRWYELGVVRGRGTGAERLTAAASACPCLFGSGSPLVGLQTERHHGRKWRCSWGCMAVQGSVGPVARLVVEPWQRGIVVAAALGRRLHGDARTGPHLVRPSLPLCSLWWATTTSRTFCVC